MLVSGDIHHQFCNSRTIFASEQEREAQDQTRDRRKFLVFKISSDPSRLAPIADSAANGPPIDSLDVSPLRRNLAG